MHKLFRDIRNDKIQSQLDKRDRAQNLWPHHPDKLLLSDVVYPVKFYGSIGVTESKGDLSVKSAVQKLSFRKNATLAEGQKPYKMFLSIAADKICLRETKRKFETEWFKVSQVSYCADDRAEKRVVAIIVAKTKQRLESEQNIEDGTFPFLCYVFESEKFAEEIVRTIGQAFDLSYRKFMSDESKEMQVKNQMTLMVKKIEHLTNANRSYVGRIQELESALKANGIKVPRSANCQLPTTPANTPASNNEYHQISVPPIQAPPPLPDKRIPPQVNDLDLLVSMAPLDTQDSMCPTTDTSHKVAPHTPAHPSLKPSNDLDQLYDPNMEFPVGFNGIEHNYPLGSGSGDLLGLEAGAATGLDIDEGSAAGVASPNMPDLCSGMFVRSEDGTAQPDIDFDALFSDNFQSSSAVTNPHFVQNVAGIF